MENASNKRFPHFFKVYLPARNCYRLFLSCKPKKQRSKLLLSFVNNKMALTRGGPQHFFKVIIPAALQEKKLRIPDKFVRKFGDELSAFATLTIPNGRVWEVGLSKDGGKIWFHDGWDKFIEHYSISSGYFLVFKYEKYSNFHVLIFDMTSCEIHYPYNEIENEDSPEIFGSSKRKWEQATNLANSSSKGECEMRSKKCKMEELLECVKETNDVNDSEPDHCSNYKIWNPRGNLHSEKRLTRNAAQNSLARDKDLQIDQTKFKTTTRHREDEHSVNIKDEKMLLATLENSGIFIHGKNRYFTAEKREREIDVARLFEPRNPSFMILLQSSHLSNSLYVPMRFANEYLGQETRLVNVQVPDGREFPLLIGPHRGSWRTKRGLVAIAKELNAHVGDICVFELIRVKGMLLKASVFSCSTV